jgi:transposase
MLISLAFPPFMHQSPRGLQDDVVAITAGLTLEWNNGVTEGHIHRLKLVKRQGYGRAGFALLRQRVLQAA